jgi:class 3 adenylate cyclase
MERGGAVDLSELNDWLSEKVKTEFAINPEVVDATEIDVLALPIDARKWTRLEDVVAVVADLKSSTQFSYTQQPASTGAVMEAAVCGLTEVLDRFGVNYMQAQGDGGFGLFWGHDRYERALCAAITIQTFSRKTLEPAIVKKWPSLPETGFKVGVACGPVLVKRVGKARKADRQDPVWVGKPVNYAAKCAQQTVPHEMLVTGSVWDWVATNDYLSMTCDCGSGPSREIWIERTIEHLRPDDPEASGRVLTSAWCEVHGAEFCDAVLAGEKTRASARIEKSALQTSILADSLAAVRAQMRRDRRNRRNGLGGRSR